MSVITADSALTARYYLPSAFLLDAKAMESAMTLIQGNEFDVIGNSKCFKMIDNNNHYLITERSFKSQLQAEL